MHIFSQDQTMSIASYRMPAEWERHRACLILYPHNSGVFRNGIHKNASTNIGDDKETTLYNKKCEPARYEVRNIARAVCFDGEEDVVLFCNSNEEAEELRNTLIEEEKHIDETNKKIEHTHTISVHVCESDDSWCRDTGPTFVKKYDSNSDGNEICTSKELLVGLDWNFNAYGGPEEGCYWPCVKDQKVAGTICDILSEQYNNDDSSSSVSSKTITKEKVDIILEGGSFHTDGEGTILTTEECLLNPNRNPNLKKEEIEEIIMKYLGGSKIIWLPFGLANDDDTNGHVDNLATFARPGEIVLSWTDDVNDDNYKRCKAAEELILRELDAKGRKLVIHKLYLPKPMFYTSEEVNTLDGECIVQDGIETVADRSAGERLAGSYVNYYLANEAVILPQFGDDEFDKRAIDTMKFVFPLKQVIGVYSREVLLGGGNIHCITQQLPNQ